MTRGKESPLTPYQDEVLDIALSLGHDKILDHIEAHDVWWVYGDGVDPEQFKARVCVGVGHYTLLHSTGRGLPPRAGCNAPVTSEGVENARLRSEADSKKITLIRAIPQILEGLDEDGRIVRVVPGLTGTPPIWANVLRITAEELGRQPT